MRLRLALLGHELDLYLGAERPDDEQPAHLEDHTGYTVGFVAPPSAHDLLEMPDRDL